MELKEISAKTLDDFLLENKGHFLQSSAYGEVAKRERYLPHYLGLYEQEELIGTALLLEKKVGPYSTYYCPRGFIVDYHNDIALKAMIEKLKVYVKSHHGLYFKINPDFIIRKLDEQAKIKETDEENFALIEKLIKEGGSFRGFTTLFSESSAPRFTFRVDISKTEEELFDSLHSTTKKILKEKNPYHVTITKNDKTALDDFYDVMKQTALRKKMYVEPYDYFRNFYEELHKKDEADLYVASIDVRELKTIFQNKLESVETEISDTQKRPDGPKKENKLKDLDGKKNKVLKLKAQVDELKEERIVLSAIITAKFADKVWTIHGGNADRLLFLNANYELYYHILLDSKKEGYRIVDFFGSEGKVDKDSPIYGIYLFKLRFGGEFDEFIGEFDFIVRPFAHKIIQKLLVTRRKIRYHRSLKESA